MNWLLNHGRVWGILLAVAAATTSVQVLGQEKDSDATKPATKIEKKERAKPRGRLPAYFSRVVSETQREEIYKIQRDYRMQIDKLKADLAKLENDMNKDVYAVLNDEQRDRVSKLQEEARKKREARRKTTKS